MGYNTIFFGRSALIIDILFFETLSHIKYAHLIKSAFRFQNNNLKKYFERNRKMKWPKSGNFRKASGVKKKIVQWGPRFVFSQGGPCDTPVRHWSGLWGINIELMGEKTGGKKNHIKFKYFFVINPN